MVAKSIWFNCRFWDCGGDNGGGEDPSEQVSKISGDQVDLGFADLDSDSGGGGGETVSRGGFVAGSVRKRSMAHSTGMDRRIGDLRSDCRRSGGIVVVVS